MKLIPNRILLAGAGLVLAGAAAGGAQAASGGATNLNIQINDGAYTLNIGALASLGLSNTTAADGVRWWNGTITSGLLWNTGTVTISTGVGGIVITTAPVASGTVIDATYMIENYNSQNGVMFGQWNGGVNTVTTTPGVCTLGYGGLPPGGYGCLAGHVNVEGTHPVGDGVNANSENLIYGFSFVDGAQTGYGWFDIGLTLDGAAIQGNVGNLQAADYAVANDPVYYLTLNGYGYSTDATVTAGVLPRGAAGAPEPSAWATMLLGIGAVGAIGRRRRRLGPGRAPARPPAV